MDHPDPEAKFEIESTWSRAKIQSTNVTAAEYLNRLIAAERWCMTQFRDDQFFKYGTSFYFEQEEDCFHFKLVWC